MEVLFLFYFILFLVVDPEFYVGGFLFFNDFFCYHSTGFGTFFHVAGRP